MSNIVDLDIPVTIRSPQELLKYFAKKDINQNLKHVVIISQDTDGALDVSYSEMDPAELCFLTMFLQNVVSRGLTEED